MASLNENHWIKYINYAGKISNIKDLPTAAADLEGTIY